MSDALLQEILADPAQEVTCPTCGYDLQGLQGSFCPECNEELALRLAVAEPMTGTFVTGLITLAMGTGFGVSVAIWEGLAIFGLVSGGTMPTRMRIPIAVLVLFAGPSLFAWIRWRQQIRRAPSPLPVLLVILAILATAGLIVGFFSMVG